MTNNDTKLMIINNFIDWYTTNEDEREAMKKNSKTYVDEDWVDEVQSRIDEVLKPVKEVLTDIAEDSLMAIEGDWDCSTQEGLEGFTSQLDAIDRLSLIEVKYPE
jgi:hypothetical protein